MKIQSIQWGLTLSFLAIVQFAKAQDINEAIKMYNYERYESAKKILTPLAATNPQANYYLGLIEISMGNLKSATTIFTRNASDIANATGIARVLFEEKKKDEAMKLLNTLVGKAKKKEIPTTLKLAADAITYTNGGDLNKAVEWYQKSNDISTNPETYLAMGDAYNDIQGGGGNAMSRWEDAASKMSNASLAYYKMGKLWYDAKNYDSAIACYNRASNLDPNNPLPYKSFADSYYKINKYGLAKQNIEKYLKVGDNSIDDQLYYINILYLGGDYKEAISKINEMQSKGVEKPYLNRLLGYSNLQLANYTEALANMDNFFTKIEKNKIIPMDYNNYAKILMNTPGKETMAADYFQKGFDIDTVADKSVAYRELAESYKNASDFKNAAVWYNKLIEKSPTTAEFLDYYYAGYSSYYMDDYANATQNFVKMEQAFPEDPTGIFWQAKVASAIDKDTKTGGAAELYKKYLAKVGDAVDRKADIAKAYEYLALLAYNKKDMTNAATYSAKALSADPNSSVAAQVAKIVSAMSNKTPTTPTPPTTPKKK
jgi:tetratricopeptide (TPR) repeat protein